MVVELQRQLQQHGVLVVPSPISPFRIRKREDYVPATEHEVLEWMADGQEDMTAALIARNTTEAASISSLITDATSHQHGAVTGSKDARTTSKYGLRGSRVGQASNSGPPSCADSAEEPQLTSPSDEEPLVRPKMGRDVLPRFGEGRVAVPLASSPVPRPSRRLVLVAEGEHDEATHSAGIYYSDVG